MKRMSSRFGRGPSRSQSAKTSWSEEGDAPMISLNLVYRQGNPVTVLVPSSLTMLQLTAFVARTLHIPNKVVLALARGASLDLDSPFSPPSPNSTIGEVLSSGTPHTLIVHDAFNATINGRFSEDEAIALALQESQTSCSCGSKEDARSTSKTTAAVTSYYPSPRPQQHQEASPLRHDTIGFIICQGSTSQYTFDNGQSACTAICLVATKHLLSLPSCHPGCHEDRNHGDRDMSQLSPQVVDRIFQQGILKHSALQSLDHSSVDDIWKQPIFADVVSSLTLFPAHRACLPPALPHQSQHSSSSSMSSSRQDQQRSSCRMTGYLDALKYAASFAPHTGQRSKVAMLLTTCGETVLCVKEQGAAAHKNSDHSWWYLFDSHGQSHEQSKKAYIKKFHSMESLASALQLKYPGQDFGDNSFLSEMYNSFESFPVVICRGSNNDNDVALQLALQRSRAAASGAAVGGESDKKAGDKKADDFQYESDLARALRESLLMDLGQVDNGDDDDADKKMPPTTLPPATIYNEPTASRPSNQASPIVMAAPPRPPGNSSLEIRDFLDPILHEVMADPVTCKDGHVYERSSIEHHFRVRIQAEEQRLAGIQGGTDHTDDTACCRRRREPIQLMSPMTQEVLSSNELTPCRLIETQIVRYVENGALDMTVDDIKEWNRKRRQKRINDDARAKESREQAARLQQQNEQAELAEQRREAEAQAGPQAMNQGGVITKPCERVRLDRNVRLQRERISDNDTGLSAELCEEGDRIFPDYVLSCVASVKCMVTCCTQVLSNDSPSWCSRCGRLVCNFCLSFSLTNIEETNPNTLHRVCVDCVSQLIDVLNPTDHRMSQTRAIIQRVYIDRHLAQLSNIAGDLQDMIVLHETGLLFGPRLVEIGQEIDHLERRRSGLEIEIRQANKVTENARENMGDAVSVATSGVAESMENLHAEQQELSKTLLQLQERGPPDGEAEQFQYAIQLGELSTQLEMIEIDLSLALSSVSNGQESAPSTVTPISTTPPLLAVSTKLLEAQCEKYQRDLETMRDEGPPADEEEQIQFVARRAEMADLCEEVQIQLAKSKCEAAGSPASISGTELPSNPLRPNTALASLLDLLQQKTPRSQRGFFRKNRKKNVDIAALGRLVASLESNFYVEGCAKRIELQLDGLAPHIKVMYTKEIDAAKAEISGHLQNILHEDITTEYLRLQAVDLSTLSDDDTTSLVLRLSELDAIFRVAENNIMHETTEMASPLSPLQSEQPVERGKGTTATSNKNTTSSTSNLRSAVVAFTESQSLFDTMMTALENTARAFDSTVSARRHLSNNTPNISVAACRERLAALGPPSQVEWVLPLKLEFPASRTEQQLEFLRNTLTLRKVSSQRAWEEEFSKFERDAQEKRNAVEAQVMRLAVEANTAQETAEAEQAQLEQRRRQREEEVRRQEAARQERERQRQEQERLAQLEAENLRQRHMEAERSTQEAFARARGGLGHANVFGGIGDLRMCGRCKAGPVENRNCADLAAHNDNSTSYYGAHVAAKNRPNDCPNCRWHNSNWHAWPYWDGVYGPH